MSQKHRFINDARAPIPMGSTADYACVCGRRGSYEVIERHVAEKAALDARARGAAPTAPYGQLVVEDDDDFCGGNTQANYLPNEPRRPAPTGESLPLQCRDSPEPLPPVPSLLETRSIAELFQDMLRSAFQAGVTAAAIGESFETWYQREVLR